MPRTNFNSILCPILNYLYLTTQPATQLSTELSCV